MRRPALLLLAWLLLVLALAFVWLEARGAGANVGVVYLTPGSRTEEFSVWWRDYPPPCDPDALDGFTVVGGDVWQAPCVEDETTARSMVLALGRCRVVYWQGHEWERGPCGPHRVNAPLLRDEAPQ